MAAVPQSLLRLLTAPGPSGQEELAAKAWREEAAAFGEVHTDVLGSSWVRVPGTGGGPLLAVVGHIDEIGLVVTHVGDDGLHRDPAARRLRPARAARTAGRGADARRPVPGVVGPRKVKRKPGEDRKPIGFDDLFLDIGAKDGAEARSLVRAGDTGVIAGEPVELRNGRLAARSLDNRIGSYVALEVGAPRRRGGRHAGRRRGARGRPGGGR